MKYQHLVSLALAAALLTGCGGTQSSPSAAADQSSDSSRSTPGAVAQAAQTDRITDQYTLEKNVSGVWGEEAVQCISVHVPQLECDSPDAAYINDELNAIYAADFREFENSEEAGQPGGEYPLIGVGWDDWWYGDCVSLVVRSRYGGTAPWRYSGWCFDFATGRQLTVAEMLQRMGLDPDEVQAQVQRQAMQAFDREMAQGAYYEGLRLGGELSQMRMDTLEYNELENLCLLLPEQDQLVLRGKYSCEEGWQQLDMELSLPTADTPVLTDTYDGVQVQLEGTQGTITLSPAPKTDQWGDIGIRVEQEHSYPILGAYNEYVDVCIGEQEDGFFHPVVYLLTKDGVVEYVDVLRCLMFGNAMICQDPIYLMEYSCLKTLANKHRSRISKVRYEYRDGTGAWGVPYETKKGKRRMMFAKYSDCKGKDLTEKVPDLAYRYSHNTTSFEERLKAKVCEVCGCTDSDSYEIHHVNKIKNLKGKADWEKVMLAKRRKTIVVCHKCHMRIHHGTKTE